MTKKIWNDIITYIKNLFSTPPKYIDGKDYVLLDYEQDKACIRILEGKYKDVIYHYTQARIDETYGIPKLQFGYVILSSAKFIKEDLENDLHFTNLMGDILTEIIINKKRKNE